MEKNLYKDEQLKIIPDNKNKENNIIKKKIRNYGIDLARIISMILIINHHIIYHGGPFHRTSPSSNLYQLLVFYNLICCSGVNIFGMISGCVCSISYKYSNLFYLLFLTFFYNIIIALLFYIFQPHLITDFTFFLYPIIISDYWYFNEYFLMFFFLPIINEGITKINEKTMKYLVINLFVIFSCLGEIKNYNNRLFRSDIFYLRLGFSYIWLLILYLVGCYIGKFNINKNKSKNYSYYLKYFILIVLAAFIRMKLIIYFKKQSLNNDLNIDYCCPAEVIISFSIMMLLSNINIKNIYLLKIISFFAPLTYGVYLIHNHRLVRIHLIGNYFFWLTKMKFYNFLLIEILCSLIIFVVCSLIDFIRLLIFNTLKIKQIITFVVKNIQILFDKIFIFEGE